MNFDFYFKEKEKEEKKPSPEKIVFFPDFQNVKPEIDKEIVLKGTKPPYQGVNYKEDVKVEPVVEPKPPKVSPLLRAVKEDVVDCPGRPRICFYGGAGSGKSSIIHSVFFNKDIIRTGFIGPTDVLQQYFVTSSPFVQFDIVEISGKIDILLPENRIKKFYKTFNQLVYLVDGSDDLLKKMKAHVFRLIDLTLMYKSVVALDIVITKSDLLLNVHPDTVLTRFKKKLYKHFERRNVYSQHIGFNIVTLYTFSVHLCMSVICRRYISQLRILNNLLNITVQNSGCSKVFLFDFKTRLSISYDNSNDPHTYSSFHSALTLVDDLCKFYSTSFSDFHPRAHHRGNVQTDGLSSINIRPPPFNKFLLNIIDLIISDEHVLHACELMENVVIVIFNRNTNRKRPIALAHNLLILSKSLKKIAPPWLTDRFNSIKTNTNTNTNASTNTTNNTKKNKK